MLTRREFGTLAIAGVLVGLNSDTTVEAAAINGVHLGVQTYSFRDLPRPAGATDSVDVVIKAMQEAGVTECELFAPQLEPQFPQGARGQRGAPPSPEAIKAREDLRKWRLETLARSLQEREQEVRRGRHHDHRLLLQHERQLHRRRNRSWLRDDQGARHHRHDDVDADDGGEADGAARRQTQDGRSACTATRTSPTRTSSRRRRASPRR